MSGLLLATRAGLRRLLMLPRYGAVGLHDPQDVVEVWLHGHGEPADVTPNNVVAALRPFTIGIMFENERLPSPVQQGLKLQMQERSGGRLLGVIHLRQASVIPLQQHSLCLFETPDFESYAAPAPSLRLHDFLTRRRAAATLRRNPHNFQMTHTDLGCSFVFYMCPRPVVLVTVGHGGKGNMFPMDLIGPTDSPWYTMALRKTSPAVELMKGSGRMALASIPLSYRNVVYRLGRHHLQPSIDLSALPFRTTASPLWGLPVFEDALRLREVRVKEFHDVGSHVLFVTSVERETLPMQTGEARVPQLFHCFQRAGSRWAVSAAGGREGSLPRNSQKEK